MSGESEGSGAMSDHIARYLAGAPKEAAQFDFLIGVWRVRGERYDDSGDVRLKYEARWRAEHLHDRRFILDDFVFLSPSGEELSSFLTLRTYAPALTRWEIAGLAALEPGLNGRWNGRAVGAEMHLEAEIRTPEGRVTHQTERFFDITPDAFHWESLDSRDDRATWTRSAALEATRVS
jgi:hypothetical protein